MVGTETSYFSAYLSREMPLESGVLTKIRFDVRDLDSHGGFDPSTHRFTPQLAGKYRVTVSYIATGRAITISLVRIYKNGNPIYEASGVDVRTQQPTRTVSAIVDMNGTTDYLEGWTAVTGMDPALAGGNEPRYTWFDAQYVGP